MGFLLDEESIKLLRFLKERFGRGLVYGPSLEGPTREFTLLNYRCKTPAGGIAAWSGNLNDVVPSAECDAYRLNDQEKLELWVDDYGNQVKVKVYNYSQTAAAGSEVFIGTTQNADGTFEVRWEDCEG